MGDPWTIKDTLFAIGSVTGSVSGIGSAFWHVLNFRKERLDLRLGADVALVEIGGKPSAQRYLTALGASRRPMIRIRVTNHGRRETFVEGIGGTVSTGEAFLLGEPGFSWAPKPDGVPCLLKDGEPLEVHCPLALLGQALGLEVTGLHALDGRGKRWCLPHPEFLNVQAAAREFLAEAHKDSGMEEIAQETRADATTRKS